MPNWKAVAAGIVVFPVVIGVGIATGGLVMLVAGFPSGVLAGYIAGGEVRSGLWHAFLAAVGVAILNAAFVVPMMLSLPDTEPASTFAVGGILWLLFFVPTWATECLLGGGVVGAVRWARDDDG